MEGLILEMEKRVQELQKTLNDPEFYVTRAKEAPAVVAEMEEARAGVARLYARWEELDRAGRGGL
jgi:ATP-binding cassette subfamily F protein uup